MFAEKIMLNIVNFIWNLRTI